MENKAMESKPKIVLVDDDPAILDSYSLLWKNRFTLVCVSDLGAALSTVKNTLFDLLITDKNLGVHRWIEPLLNYMKEEKPYIPVILFSGEDWARAKQELYCTTFIPKGRISNE